MARAVTQIEESMAKNKVHEINLFISSRTVQALVYRCDRYQHTYPQVLTSKIYHDITMASFVRCSKVGRETIARLGA